MAHFPRMKTPFVYILASQRDGVLYVGVTRDLAARMAQHAQHLVEGFTAKYDVTMLVHFERFNSMHEAIAREKALKHWRRAWKVKLIERGNPEWINLYDPATGAIATPPDDIARHPTDVRH